MKIKIPGIYLAIGKSAAIAAAKAVGGHLLEDAITAAKATDLGKAAIAIVSDLENSALPGDQRMTKAIADAAPYVIGFVARGGFKAVEADVATFARQLLESVLTDVRATATASIAQAVLDVAKAA